MIASPVTFLLIEDDAQEAALCTSVLGEVAADIRVVHVQDGDAAIAWLEQVKISLPPLMILLDLNLNGQDGHVLLEQLKQDPVFRLLPVIILTNSQDPVDVMKAYQMYASGYLVKPSTPEEYREMLTVLTGYWHGVAQLPT